MRKGLLVLLVLVSVLAVSVFPVLAVTDGTLDGDGHPAVVLLLMDVKGAPAFRCSGTLLSPTVLLTAGHCAGAPGEFSGMRVFTESDVEAGRNTVAHPNPNPTNSYPTCAIGHGVTCFEAVDWASHPLYPTGPFFLHDVGVVILEAPGVVLADPNDYGVLPAVNQYDTLKTQRGRQDKTFTAVGYGLQQSFPDAASWKTVASRTRYVATPYLIQINGGIVGNFSFLLSNNAYSGGTCFGDSGGPNFQGSGPTETNIVAGVTSFGLNGNCAGTGGVFRMDRANVQDFIYDFAGDELP